ncbi:MAG: GIY-YIG nuclease family protein [Bacteroidia bacterium]|nr:GIY-YIG nuclease family protein [Bacteroidia bacterium]
MAVFYILFSKAKDRYYIGYTTDILAERIRRHNANHKGFTGKTSDWELVYSESYSDNLRAHTREREVKRWKSRKMIEKLIKTQSSEVLPGSEHPE